MNQPASPNSDTHAAAPDIARANDPGAKPAEKVSAAELFVPFKVVSAEPLRLVAVDPAGNHFTFDIAPSVQAVSYRGQDPAKPHLPIFGFALGFNASPASAEPTSAEKIAAWGHARDEAQKKADQAENRLTIALDTIGDERREIGAILVDAGLLEASRLDSLGLLGAVQEFRLRGTAHPDVEARGPGGLIDAANARAERLAAEIGAIGYTLATQHLITADDIKRLGVLGAIRQKLGLPPLPMREGADRAPVHVPLDEADRLRGLLTEIHAAANDALTLSDPHERTDLIRHIEALAARADPAANKVAALPALIADLQNRADASERARRARKLMPNPAFTGPIVLGDETNIAEQHDRQAEATARVYAALDRGERPAVTDIMICSPEAVKRAQIEARRMQDGGVELRSEATTRILGPAGVLPAGPAGQLLGMLLDAEEGACGACASDDAKSDAGTPTPRDGTRKPA